MNILFFTLVPILSKFEKGIYADMINEFILQKDEVDYFFPHKINFINKSDNSTYNGFKIRINPQKQNNFINKYISYKIIEYKFSRIIFKLKKKQTYDLLIIATPSIFQSLIISTYKRKNPNGKILLLLKDIFPDNAIDLGLFKNSFPYKLAFLYFKNIEKNLYNKVDKIGCMTPLNIEYIRSKHPFISDKLFLSPNSINPYTINKIYNRLDLSLPVDKTICIFVGNLGLPQDPQFVNQLISNSSPDLHYVFIGTGTQFSKITKSSNVLVIGKQLTQDQIDQYLVNSDFGLIFLSSKFLIPNFPSKLLSYLNAKLPIISFTNSYNDLNSNYINPNLNYWYLSKFDKDFKFTIEKKLIDKSLFNFQLNEFNIKKQVHQIKVMIGNMI